MTAYSNRNSVLVFESKASNGFFTDVARAVFPDANIFTLSNFKGNANCWVGDLIYVDDSDEPDPRFLEVAPEILERCRFLRSLDKDTALTIASRFWNATVKLFERYQFKAVFQRMIDEYTLDIVERVARYYRTPVVSYVSHFFEGYFRITSRGELNVLRGAVTQDEVDAVCTKVLKKDFKPSFSLMKEKTQLQVIKTYLRRKLIEGCYYPLLKKLERDPLNYHYNTLVLRGSNLSYVSSKRYNGFSSVESLTGRDFSKTVYLPLHMIPEATTDYWCDDRKLTDYESGIVKLIERSDKDVVFVVKEHPSMDGWRNPAFYDCLRRFPNVVLIVPHENSNELLSMIDNVVVHTGSVGVEALMRGKRAFCLTSNYYLNLHPAAIRVDTITTTELSKSIPQMKTEDFVESLLLGLWPGKWFPNKESRKSTFDQLVEASKAYIERFNG